MSGTLTVVATPIGNLGDLSPRAAEALRNADRVLAEDTRRTGKLLAHVDSEVAQTSLHEHNERERIPPLVAELTDGAHYVLVSDAGTPAVSDPGYRLIAAAAAAGVRIEPIPGPSAALAALVASGLPTDRVAFDGFLPRKGSARTERLAQMADERRTVVLFLAPHRAHADLVDLAAACGTQRRAALCRELTKLHEQVIRGPIGALIEQAKDGLRGELTLVIDGAPPAVTNVSDEDAVSRVQELIATGAHKKDAIAQVAVAANRPKREIYQAVIDAGSTG